MRKQNNNITTILTGDHIQEILLKVGVDAIMDELIDESYKAFVSYDKEDSVMTKRAGYAYMQPAEGLIEWMPIRKISNEEVLIKVVGYHPQNPSVYKVPTILSTISKYDTKTGHLTALIDGVIPTSLRTGAASAVASKLFALPESKVLGIIGCGAQSVTQLHGISRMFDLDEVYYFDIDRMTQNSFESRVKVLDLGCTFISSDIETILSKADILSTATSIAVGEGPLFQNLSSKAHLHVNAVGSDFPGKFELPMELLENSYVCPDWIDQAVCEGECQRLSQEQIGEDLSNCLKEANKFNYLKEQLTVYDSTGIALQDLVVAKIFLDHAAQLELGHQISIENKSLDQLNPYAFMKEYKRI